MRSNGQSPILGSMLLASSTLAAVGCFVGIDTSLMDRELQGDGGPSKDAEPADAGPNADVEITDDRASTDGYAPSDPSLVGQWSFEESSGATVVDASGHGNDGALVGAISRVPGISGQAIAMNGTQQMDVASLGGAAFPAVGTLSIWFEFVSSVVSTSGEWGLFDVHAPSSNRSHFALQQMPNGGADFHIDFVTAAGQPAASDSLVATSGAWNHVVLTWSLSRWDAYYAKQGDPLKPVAGATYAYAWNPSGQQFRVGTAFTGAVDELRLYSRAFSATEVGAIP